MAGQAKGCALIRTRTGRLLVAFCSLVTGELKVRRYTGEQDDTTESDTLIDTAATGKYILTPDFAVSREGHVFLSYYRGGITVAPSQAFLYRSEDDGETWQNIPVTGGAFSSVGPGFDVGNPLAFDISRKTGVFAWVENSHVQVGLMNATLDGIELGATRQQIYTSSLNTPPASGQVDLRALPDGRWIAFSGPGGGASVVWECENLQPTGASTWSETKTIAASLGTGKWVYDERTGRGIAAIYYGGGVAASSWSTRVMERNAAGTGWTYPTSGSGSAVGQITNVGDVEAGDLIIRKDGTLEFACTSNDLPLIRRCRALDMSGPGTWA